MKHISRHSKYLLLASAMMFVGIVKIIHVKVCQITYNYTKNQLFSFSNVDILLYCIAKAF